LLSAINVVVISESGPADGDWKNRANSPGFDSQAIDRAEMVIVRNQNKAVTRSSRGDPDVVLRNRPAFLAKVVVSPLRMLARR
jgi:hypothetical protein